MEQDSKLAKAFSLTVKVVEEGCKLAAGFAGMVVAYPPSAGYMAADYAVVRVRANRYSKNNQA